MTEKFMTRLKRHALPLAVLLASFTATLGAWQFARHVEQREAQQDFNQIAQQRVRQLQWRMRIDSRFLADLSGLFVASDRVTYQEFNRYINNADAVESNGGSLHLGYLSLVPAANRLAHEQLLRTAGVSDYRIKGASNAQAYLPFDYVYPMDAEARQRLVGVDVHDEPIRRAAWQQARDTGAIAATGKLNKVLVPRDRPSFLLFAPVYQGGGVPRTVEERRATIKGFVYAVYRADDLLRSAWGNDMGRRFNARLSIGNDLADSGTVYDSRSTVRQSAHKGPVYTYKARFQEAGQDWTLTFASIPGARMIPVDRLPFGILLGGVLASLLATAISVLLEARRRAARVQQEQNQRFRSLFDQNPDAVYALDQDGRFTAVNAQAEAMTGMTADELLGMSYTALIAPDQLESSLRRVAGTYAGTASHGETAIVTRGGGRIELSTTNLPIVVAGRMVGIFGVAKDVTPRKRAEQALQKAHEELEDRVRERTAALRQEVDARKRVETALRQEVDARKETEAALRELAGHLQNVREDERTRIAREIHDEFGGVLAAIKFELSMPVRQNDTSFEGAAQRNQMTVRMVDDAIISLRRIMADLRPSVLDDLGLWATLEWLANEFEARMGISALFELEGEEVDVPADLATAIFRIVQEALNNVAKHAQASVVEIIAQTTPESVHVLVQDNGRGFDAEGMPGNKCYGLLGMNERAQAFNGQVEIASHVGVGTTVTIEFPTDRPEAGRPGR